MNHRLLLLLVGLALAGSLGCQRAHPYQPRSALSAPVTTPAPSRNTPSADVVWLQSPSDTGKGDVPLVFVDAVTSPEEWSKLSAFWNDPVPAGVGAALGSGPLGAAGAVGALRDRVIRIKMPLGLGPVVRHIPEVNPPTKGKWELGRRLFFDPSWLREGGGLSCATCHDPNRGYTDGKRDHHGGRNTPTLINCVYNTSQFWDGRATYLEEVIQPAFDERDESGAGRFRHAWPGVTGRLRANQDYRLAFAVQFGTEPTLDNVGRSLATYLRTILAGNALLDRAEQERLRQKAPAATEGHYQPLLDAAALKTLDREKAVPAVVAGELAKGARLFWGKAGCVECHAPEKGTYSDGQFHNIGAGIDEYTGLNAGRQPGRFAVAPLGQKALHLIGAYRTPTLRGLLRTGPYFHNGQADELKEAVRLHVAAADPWEPFNPSLDPRLSTGLGVRRSFDLSESDLDSLVLFLKALNGDEPDRLIRTAPGGP
jgi:cytochrome c peroxidase